MIVAIYACEQIYGGLHGINATNVLEVQDIEEAREIAREMSIEVMETYGNIIEDFYEDALETGLDEDSEEFSEYLEDCINENIDYGICLVNNAYADCRTMANDYYNNSHDFLHKANCTTLD